MNVLLSTACVMALAACGSDNVGAPSDSVQPEAVELPDVPADEPDPPEEQGATTEPAIANASASPESIRWPDDPEELATIETRIGLRRGDIAGDVYAANYEALIERCMRDGGFAYGEPLDEAGRSRLQDTFQYDSEIASGGCEGWALNLAYPGNYFGADYFTALGDAYERDEYKQHLDAYDNCMINRGYTGPPEVEGLSEADAENAVESFNQDGLECDQTSGLSSADRAADVVALEVVAADQPELVDEYVKKLDDYLEARTS